MIVVRDKGHFIAASIRPNWVKPGGTLKCNSARRTGHGSASEWWKVFMRNLDYQILQINPEKLEQSGSKETRPVGREEPSRGERGCRVHPDLCVSASLGKFSCHWTLKWPTWKGVEVHKIVLGWSPVTNQVIKTAHYMCDIKTAPHSEKKSGNSKLQWIFINGNSCHCGK